MEGKDRKNQIEEEILIIPSNLSELKTIEEFSLHLSKKAALSQDQAENIAIVLTELVNNAIVHGNKLIPAKRVIVKTTYYPDRVEISVKDEGSGYDPSALNNPTKPENILRENGRGIFLVKNLIDKVDFVPSLKGMEIVITEFVHSG